MSYAAAIEQLNAMTPELYTRAGHPRHKFSLDEIRILLAELGEPQKRFPSLLIAGTNGKGSTAATLASILRAAGLRTGLYTSPHLERANERIRMNGPGLAGAEIGDDAFARIFFQVLDASHRLVESGRLPQFPSYFEILTAQAFLYFAEQRAEIAVLEVGLGGRLDATNVVDPLLSIITDISLDHMEWLGSTIAEIAREKAGILRRGGTMITLPQHPEANQVLGEVATELDVRGVSAVPYMPAVADVEGAYRVEALGAEISVDSPLHGAHQHRNLALAMAAAVELKRSFGFPVTPAAMEAGIQQTRWPGRLERIEAEGVEWILDVAHNPAGVWALRAGLRTILKEGPLHAVVFSCLRDKPVREMAQILFPLFDEVILAPLHAARAAEMDELLAAARATGVRATAAASVREAVRIAGEHARTGPAPGSVVISGSVYLVGEARGLLLREKSGHEESGPERSGQDGSRQG
jgi:dihydrofolate synthase / folylpolyglutamate synthase